MGKLYRLLFVCVCVGGIEPARLAPTLTPQSKSLRFYSCIYFFIFYILFTILMVDVNIIWTCLPRLHYCMRCTVLVCRSTKKKCLVSIKGHVNNHTWKSTVKSEFKFFWPPEQSCVLQQQLNFLGHFWSPPPHTTYQYISCKNNSLHRQYTVWRSV